MQKRRAGRVGGGCSRSGARRTEGLVASLLKVARFRYNEFRERFGREPGPDEPLLFDPRQDSPSKADPAEMRLQVIAATTATRGDPIVVLKFLGLA
ncbi:MAG: hypothetical protein ACREQN_07545 [Candidatus Binataceae bacterium]